MPDDADDAPLICARSLTKRYQRGASIVYALREVDLDVEIGSFVAVVGRSGAGKSTLLHLLAAMEPPTHGEMVVDGWHLHALERRDEARYRRETVGMVFQQFNLVGSMTAQQNVELPLVMAGRSVEDRSRRAEALLARVGLAERRHHRPAELSGGEQQRVAIARALALDAPLLLADEPTGNLDSETAASIIGLLDEVRRDDGKTVVLVTHQPADVEHAATRIVRVHDGHLVE